LPGKLIAVCLAAITGAGDVPEECTSNAQQFELNMAKELTTFAAANTLHVNDERDPHAKCPTSESLTTIKALIEQLSVKQHGTDAPAQPKWLPAWLTTNVAQSPAADGVPRVKVEDGKLLSVSELDARKLDARKATEEVERQLEGKAPGSYVVSKHTDTSKPGDGSFRLSVAAQQGQAPRHYSLTRTEEELTIFPAQRRNGNQLFRMVENIMRRGEYTSCKCIILVPGMLSLWEQTKARLRLAGLSDTVTVYKATHGDSTKEEFRKLQVEVANNPETFFLVIQDECHHGLTLTGTVKDFLDVFKVSSKPDGDPAQNVVRIMVSATADSLFILPTTDNTFQAKYIGDVELPKGMHVHEWDNGGENDGGSSSEEATDVTGPGSISPKALYFGERVRIT